MTNRYLFNFYAISASLGFLAYYASDSIALGIVVFFLVSAAQTIQAETRRYP